MGNNLRALRDRRAMSAAHAATRMNMSQSGYTKLERGERQLTAGTIKRASETFGVPEELIVSDELPGILPPANADKALQDRWMAMLNNDPVQESKHYRPPPTFFDNRNTMPVYSSAAGGPGELIISSDPFEYVPRPYTLDGINEAYAVLITGESMLPAYEPGDYAWANPVLPIVRDIDAILYRIDEATGDARASIKRIESQTSTAWKVSQYNPAKSFDLPKRDWKKVHRVTGKFHRR